MKKIISMVCMVIAIQQVFACDICGCGAGNYYIGILPEFRQKIFGIRYRQNSLRTHLGAGGAESYLTTGETYRTAELWGGWTISGKIRLMASLPLSLNEKSNQVGTATKTGLGDAALQGFYRVMESRKTVSSKLLVQTIWLGAGIKAPTGKYDQSQKEEPVESANIFQLGTGSTDFTLNAMYDMRLMDAGINLNAGYKINTANTDNYRYGNKLSINLQAYYKFRIRKNLTIAPNAGLSLERASDDHDAGYKTDVSGGSILLGTAGMEATTNNFAFGANWQPPLYQHLANGFVRANNRFMIHVAVIL